MMHSAGSPEALRTVITLPPKSRSLFPEPVYVPSAISTMSPGTAASIAAWIVGYWLGTCSVVVTYSVTLTTCGELIACGSETTSSAVYAPWDSWAMSTLSMTSFASPLDWPVDGETVSQAGAPEISQFNVPLPPLYTDRAWWGGFSPPSVPEYSNVVALRPMSVTVGSNSSAPMSAMAIVSPSPSSGRGSPSRSFGGSPAAGSFVPASMHGEPSVRW